MIEQKRKFKIDKITYSKRSLGQRDVSKEAFSDKPLVHTSAPTLQSGQNGQSSGF